MLPRQEERDDGVCFYLTIECQNRAKMFLIDRDFRTYGQLLKRHKRSHRVRIFAFCFLPQAVHLIVQPRRSERLASFVWDLNRDYEKYFGQKISGYPLRWSNRFGCHVIDNDRALFDFIKYLESLPVGRDAIMTPIQYPWSSCRLRVLGQIDSVLDVCPWQDLDPAGSQSLTMSL